MMSGIAASYQLLLVRHGKFGLNHYQITKIPSLLTHYE